MNAAKVIWGWYVRELNSKPLLTQAVTTGVIYGLGDIIAQQAVDRRTIREHKWRRTVKVTLIGLCFTGPVIATWFKTLDKIFGPTITAKDAVKKMLVDQLAFAPVLFLCLLPLFSFTQGNNWPQTKEKLSKEYFNTLMGCYKLWPGVQLINFYIIPLKFRVNFTNVVSLGWNTYVAWVAHRK